MAVVQTQYDFIMFSGNGAALNFKGALAGLLLCKTSRTSIGAVKIDNYAKAFHLVPLTYFLSAAIPVTAIMFPGDRGMPVAGLHVTVCSNMNVIAIRR